jgi:hypothetical protein
MAMDDSVYQGIAGKAINICSSDLSALGRYFNYIAGLPVFMNLFCAHSQSYHLGYRLEY